MARVYNFSAGPAVLPLWALEKAKDEFLDYNGSGMSIVECSHRSKVFDAVIKEAEKNLREIWGIPDNFKVLFLQGGASTQFFMVPMNLAGDQVIDFVLTGSWSDKALKEAKILGKKTNIAYTSKEGGYKEVPTSSSEIKLSNNSAYVHITSNNTIYGTQQDFPETNGVPIVADMSSDALCKPIDFKNVGLIYAGAQKNLGPSGLTVVIIREDLLERIPEGLPTMLNYKTHVKEESLYNTPPTFSIYMLNLVLQWVKNEGGLSKIYDVNKKKASLLYDVIDQSNGFYIGHAKKDSRSIMNVTFNIKDSELEAKFVDEASKIGLKSLKGHRSIGGMRASIYNAMPVSGCEKLAEFMKKFQKENQ